MIKRAARRFIDRKGEPVTIRTYSQSGTDEYGDPEFTESTASAKAVIMIPSEILEVRSAGGEEVDVDARIWMADDVTLNEPTDDEPQSSVIERDNTGDRYRILMLFTDDNGLHKIEAKRFDQ